MIYVASPYSHPDTAHREMRYEMIRNYVAKHQPAYMEMLYSPIVHWHDAAVQYDMPTNWDFWWRLNREMIDLSSKILVVQLDGWDKSKGVEAELDYAKLINKPVTFHDPSQI